MKQNYAKFNDVIFIDAINNTNNYQMALIFLSVVDSEDKNQIVFLDFVSNESKGLILKYSKTLGRLILRLLV